MFMRANFSFPCPLLDPPPHLIDSIIDLLSFVATIFFLIRWTHGRFCCLFYPKRFGSFDGINSEKRAISFRLAFIMRYNEVVKYLMERMEKSAAGSLRDSR